MSPKQRYWFSSQARFGMVLLIGSLVMWLLVSNGQRTAGYALGVVALLVAVLVAMVVDRKNAQNLDRQP